MSLSEYNPSFCFPAKYFNNRSPQLSYNQLAATSCFSLINPSGSHCNTRPFSSFTYIILCLFLYSHTTTIISYVSPWMNSDIKSTIKSKVPSLPLACLPSLDTFYSPQWYSVFNDLQQSENLCMENSQDINLPFSCSYVFHLCLHVPFCPWSRNAPLNRT